MWEASESRVISIPVFNTPISYNHESHFCAKYHERYFVCPPSRVGRFKDENERGLPLRSSNHFSTLFSSPQMILIPVEHLKLCAMLTFMESSDQDVSEQ